MSTERLLLRPTTQTDRPGYIDLLCDEEARRYLGGALNREEIETTVPRTPAQRPGVFAVELTGKFIGVVSLGCGTAFVLSVTGLRIPSSVVSDMGCR